jgi:hypothetical protein
LHNENKVLPRQKGLLFAENINLFFSALSHRLKIVFFPRSSHAWSYSLV